MTSDKLALKVVSGQKQDGKEISIAIFRLKKLESEVFKTNKLLGLKPDATTGELYLDEHGPSLRGLYDLGDRANSRVVHSTGQSGIVWSPLYRSLAEPWRRVEGVPLFVPASALVQTLSISGAL